MKEKKIQVADPEFSEDQRRELYEKWKNQQKGEPIQKLRKVAVAQPPATATAPVQTRKLPHPEDIEPTKSEHYFEIWGDYQSPSQAFSRYQLFAIKESGTGAANRADALTKRQRATRVSIYEVTLTRKLIQGGE